jgi:hypothetical protein
VIDKGINTVDFDKRRDDLNNIHVLFGEFGDLAYPVIDKYYTGVGYETGVDRILTLTKEKKFSSVRFRENPVKGIEEFLYGYFKERGGNLPKIWSEGDTVFLKTEASVHCITAAAEKEVKIRHSDICNVYCRAVAKGLVMIFQDFFPGIQIQFYNVSSRRKNKGDDCVEAFKIIVP